MAIKNLKGLGGKETERKKYSELTIDELHIYLDNLLKVIEYRSQYSDEIERVNNLYSTK